MTNLMGIERQHLAFLCWTEKAVGNPIKWGIFVAGSALLSYWEWGGLPLSAGTGLMAYAVQNLFFTVMFARDEFSLERARLLILLSYTFDFLFVAWLGSSLVGTGSQVAFLVYVSLFFKAGLYYPAFRSSLLILPVAVVFYLAATASTEGTRFLLDYSFRPKLFLLMGLPAVVVYTARLLDYRERDLWDLNKRLQQNSGQLRRQTRELEAIINGMRDGLVVTDSTLNVVAVNHVARDILRWESELPPPNPLISSENGEALKEVVVDAMGSTDGSSRRDVKMVASNLGDSEPRTYQAVASCIPGENGFAGQVVVILRDVTEQVQLEEAKSNFLSVISHELRTPLSSIKGFLTIILAGKTGSLNDTQRDFLTTAKGQAESLHGMINDLVEYSRIQVQRTELELLPVSLFDISKAVCTRLMPLAVDKGVMLHNLVPQGLQPIEGDQFRLDQVVSNLVCNALKFTSAGGTITLSAKDGGEEVRFTVMDTGVGIAPSEQEKIFEPFYQVSRGMARTHGGMGLGLAICKSIIDRHNGRIWVESAEGRGACFHVALQKQPSLQGQEARELVA